MFTKNINVILETGNSELLINKYVEVISYDVIGGLYSVGEKLLIKSVMGTRLKVISEKGYNFSLRNDKVKLIDVITLPVYCTSCNSLYNDRHQINCINIDKDEKEI